MRRKLTLLLVALALAGLAVLGAYRMRGSGWSSAAPPHLIELPPPHGEAELVGDGASTKMRAITVDIPSSLSWRVALPRGARLETHLSFARAKLGELEGVTCRARVETGGDDGSKVVLIERQVHPGSPWEPYRADVPEGRGPNEIRLSVECPTADRRTFHRAARWSVPLIAPPRRRGEANVLLITIDTLRADHLRAYGYARATSPNLDRLASRGLLFRQAETVQSATWPALTSLHTSLYPSAHGVVWNGHPLPDGLPTLAQLLHAKHFSTSAFITNMTRGRHPGFSRLFLSRGNGQAEDDERAVEAAREQLHLERERRFFLWVHLVSPHADYRPPAPYDSAFTRTASRVSADIDSLSRLRERGATLTEADVAHLVGLYDGEVLWVDELVGRLLATLRQLELDRNTLVVFTADHGEDLYEHNRYFFHSPSIYRSSMQIPLVLALPGVLPEGQVTDHPASLADVAPTILGLLGLPSVPHFQGENLLPGGSLPPKPVRAFVFGETNGKIYALRSPEWRFVYNPERLQPAAPGGAYPIGELELYDQRNDPGERKNLAGSRPDLVRALTAEILAWKRRHLQKALPSQGLDPEALDELRALGYVSK